MFGGLLVKGIMRTWCIFSSEAFKKSKKKMKMSVLCVCVGFFIELR